MGIALKDLIIGEEIGLEDLKGKVLAVDSYNMLYQFLTTIRGRDGTLLMDSSGNITSHLVGLFSRVTKLMQQGMKLVFVFDGKAPDLKKKERERRKELKIAAAKEYDAAVKREDIDAMKKYASRMTRLTPDLVDEAKLLIKSLGLPIVDAPSEGEAQAAYMVKKGDCYASVSQDFDSLVHQTPLLVKNLSIAGKRKKTNKLSYETVKPELINLADNLNNLGIDQDQLIALAILVGTDYNIGGVKGIGPKKAINLVKEYGNDFDAMFKSQKWEFDFPWTDVFYTIKKMPMVDDYNISFGDVHIDKLKELLVEKHDFSMERVNGTIDKLMKQAEEKKQKGLGDFF